jgi:hypothetical protein
MGQLILCQCFLQTPGAAQFLGAAVVTIALLIPRAGIVGRLKDKWHLRLRVAGATA